jgi:hypothetical protein
MAGPEAAIGAAVGVAGLFNTVVAWFDYVYVAKQTWPRLQTHLLKLDNAQLRLTRWGRAVGLSGSRITDEESLKVSGEFLLNQEQEGQAVKTFEVIEEKFIQCQTICHKYRRGRREDDPRVQEHEIALFGPTWNPMRRYLHEAMKDIIEGRKNKLRTARKAKFAIYDETHLVDLIRDINDLTDTLYKIFPPPEDKQTQLCKEEVDKFIHVLQELENAIKERDPTLGSAVQSILNQKVSKNRK